MKKKIKIFNQSDSEPIEMMLMDGAYFVGPLATQVCRMTGVSLLSMAISHRAPTLRCKATGEVLKRAELLPLTHDEFEITFVDDATFKM